MAAAYVVLRSEVRPAVEQWETALAREPGAYLEKGKGNGNGARSADEGQGRITLRKTSHVPKYPSKPSEPARLHSKA